MKAQGKFDCALRMLDISSQPNHVGPVNAFTSVKLLKKLLRTKASKRILDWDVKDTLNDNRMSGQDLFSEEVLAKTKEAMKLAAPRELRVADQSTAQKGKNAAKPTIKVQSVSYSLSKQGPHHQYRSGFVQTQSQPTQPFRPAFGQQGQSYYSARGQNHPQSHNYKALPGPTGFNQQQGSYNERRGGNFSGHSGANSRSNHQHGGQPFPNKGRGSGRPHNRR